MLSEKGLQGPENCRRENIKLKPEINGIHSTPAIHVAPSPHKFSTGMTTRNMMRDVSIAFGPVVLAAVYYFRWFAVKQLLICVAASVVAEAIFTRMRAQSLCLGEWIFGVGIGVLVMLLRFLSGYPEGVMFAVLLMNAVTPLINRWTIPRPFGGV